MLNIFESWVWKKWSYIKKYIVRKGLQNQGSRGSKIKIQKGSTVEIQNNSTAEIQNSCTVDIQKGSNFTCILIKGNFS